MYKSLIIALSIMAALNGCGSGGSSGDTSRSGTDTAGRVGDVTGSDHKPPTLSISLTDAVVDSAQKVVVQFTGLSIKSKNGDDIEYTFETPQSIDLLSLQGTVFTNLISEQVIPTGKYTSIRLHVNASKDGVNDSYIQLDDGSEHELYIPSGSQSGLKINSNFELKETEDLHLMIDFDLRKSVVVNHNGYKLRPTLRMVDMSDMQNISGSINASLLTARHCSDSNPDTDNVVYLFEEHDMDEDDMDVRNAVTSAAVNLNPANGQYEYTLAFMPPGEYTLAFTCRNDGDDDDDHDDDDFFSYSENISIESSIPTPAPLR